MPFHAHKRAAVGILVVLGTILTSCNYSTAEVMNIFGSTSDTQDWVTLEGDGVSLMVPPEFEGGSVDDILAAIDVTGSMLGDEFDQIFEIARQNPGLYKLFAYAPTLVEGGVLTNLNITGAPLGMDLPMTSVLELLSGSFPDSVEIVSSEVIELGSYDSVGRMVASLAVLGTEQRLTLYVYTINQQLYALTFTTSGDAFEELTPIFEQIAATFEVTTP
jgi:hypothetical protein